jgi:hypothetical protein
MARHLADAGVLSNPNATSPPAAPVVVRVHAAPAQVINSFDPDKSFGTSMDIQSRESINKIYEPENINVCLSAGWGPISYRLHTTETIDYWHWNPSGRWTWDRDAKIICYTAFYYASRMINDEWVTHRSGPHHLYFVDVGIEDPGGNALVTSYAVRRPDGRWALLLINKDRDNTHPVRIAFEEHWRDRIFFRHSSHGHIC